MWIPLIFLLHVAVILTVSICDLTQVSVYLSRIRHGLTMPETEDKQEF